MKMNSPALCNYLLFESDDHYANVSMYHCDGVLATVHHVSQVHEYLLIRRDAIDAAARLMYFLHYTC